MKLLIENFKRYLNEGPEGSMTGGQMTMFNDTTGKPNFIIHGPYQFGVDPAGSPPRRGYIVKPTPDGLAQAKQMGIHLPNKTTALYFSSGKGGGAAAGDLTVFGGQVDTPFNARGPITQGELKMLYKPGTNLKKSGIVMSTWMVKNPALHSYYTGVPAVKPLNPYKFTETLINKLHANTSNAKVIPNTKAVNQLLGKYGALKPHWAKYPSFMVGSKLVDFFDDVDGGYTGLEPPHIAERKIGLEYNLDHYWEDFSDEAVQTRSKLAKNFAKTGRASIAKNAQLVDNISPAAVNAVESAIPKKPGMWKRVVSKLPGVGKFALLATVGGTVLLDADAAYASEGVKGALKVYANAGVDFLPIIGDAKGVVELVGMLLPHNKKHEKWKQKMTLDQAEEILAGRGPVGTRGYKISAAPEPETPAAHKARGERGSTTYKGSGLEKHFKENAKLTKSKLQQLIQEEIKNIYNF